MLLLFLRCRRFVLALAACFVVVMFGATACNKDEGGGGDKKADVQVLPPDFEDGGGGADSPYYFSTPHTGAPSSHRSCVVRGEESSFSTLECVVCPNGEICFTQLVCGPTSNGSACIERNDATPRGDNRCHRECETNNDCGPDEDCFHEPFTACTDYNGGPKGRGLCCSFGGCSED